MSDFLRGLEITREEKRDLITRFAQESGLDRESARRQFDRYLTTSGEERATPTGERAKLLSGLIRDYYDTSPSRGANTEERSEFGVKTIDKYDLRYNSRGDAERIANSILNNRSDAFHNNRMTDVFVKYLPPGTEIQVYDPQARTYRRETIGRNGVWIVETHGYSSRDVPVDS